MDMVPNKENSDIQNTMYEQRRKEIQRMPPGAERDKALSDLMRDYEGRGAAAQDKLGTATTDFSAAMKPLDMRRGPSGNPFAVDVAPHELEQVGRGMQMYNASKKSKEARATQKELSEGKERAGMDLMGAGLSEAEIEKKKREGWVRGLRGMTGA